MALAARVRQLLARWPLVYWAVVALLAGAAGWLVLRAASDVEAARRAWGEQRPAYVALVDVPAGAPLDGVVERRPLPAPMVPLAAVEAVAVDAVARQPIAAGEVLVGHDVGAVGAPQALIPFGWLAVAVAEPVASGARVGDDVAVASGGVLLAGDGVVVGLVGSSVLVAVPAEEAPHVAQAAAGGDVAVLLVP